MSLRNPNEQWEKLGMNDPYYGVLSQDKFRKEKINADSHREFFKSGQDHIDFVLKTIRRNVNSGFSPRTALDFGCGIGRCSIPLADICESVVGVDVSDSMLREARKQCSERSISNLELMNSDDTLSCVSGLFDLVHAFLVFQHIPQKRGEKIFTRLVQLLSDDGVGVVQFVYHRGDRAGVKNLGRLRKTIPLVHNFVNLLYKKPFSDPLMEKNVYDLNRLLVILFEHRCDNVHIRFHGKGKLRSIVLFFQKKQDQILHDVFDDC